MILCPWLIRRLALHRGLSFTHVGRHRPTRATVPASMLHAQRPTTHLGSFRDATTPGAPLNMFAASVPATAPFIIGHRVFCQHHPATRTHLLLSFGFPLVSVSRGGMAGVEFLSETLAVRLAPAPSLTRRPQPRRTTAQAVAVALR